ncbi:MAG: hypothetical protein KAZ88_11180 [Acidimicrobiia bacterium]|jgi:hypothetical protein|nr:hypothetical protein [Acidimicrobiia bacterium]MBP8181543.1 hypothetical protein [Acidimicrobiia bacterium]
MTAVSDAVKSAQAQLDTLLEQVPAPVAEQVTKVVESVQHAIAYAGEHLPVDDLDLSSIVTSVQNAVASFEVPSQLSFVVDYYDEQRPNINKVLAVIPGVTLTAPEIKKAGASTKKATAKKAPAPRAKTAAAKAPAKKAPAKKAAAKTA